LGRQIIEEAVSQSMEHNDEVVHHGTEARRLFESGFQFTHQMALAAVKSGQNDLLVDQAEWAVNRLPHDNVQMPDLIKRLKRYRQSVINHLKPDHASQVTPYLDLLIAEINSHLKT
jgi:ferric-dicitrate binding protein FerR (iron transport regulator)